MKTISKPVPVDQAAADQVRPPAFHVELTPVAPAAPLFHALHGAVPAAPVPHLPNHLEDDVVQPPKS